MRMLMRTAIIVLTVTGAGLAHAHTGHPGNADVAPVAEKQAGKSDAAIVLAQRFRATIFRGGGRGLPPNPCRGRCTR